MSTDTGILLIHGAGLNSSIWDEIKPYIKIPVLAVNFPNRIPSIHSTNELSYHDYCVALYREIENWKVDKFIVVTHSIGGCIGLNVVRQFQERIKGFVGISAAIPQNGDSFLSCFSGFQRLMLFLRLNFSGTRPPAAIIRNQLCSDLNETQADAIVKSYTPESKSLYADKCFAPTPTLPSLYIHCRHDEVLSMGIQKRMAGQLSSAKIITMDSGHLPMVSKPIQLAEHLNIFTTSL